MAIVASSHIFGGSQYSVAGAGMLRMVGQKKWPITPIKIGKTLPGKSGKDRVYRPGLTEPYMPNHASEDYHPGGNSVCYMIQTAHLMGCDPIYLLGFTLQSGSGYFFGMNNPVLKRRAKYQDDGARPLHWLRWYSKRYPGRVKLWPGWAGPINDALETVGEDEYKSLLGMESEQE